VSDALADPDLVPMRTDPMPPQPRDLAVWNLIVGRWLDKNGLRIRNVVADRYKVFDAAALYLGEESILYAEFGVYHGDALRYRSRLLSGKNAVLHGFDSFEGLPEGWGFHAKGTSSTEGVVPEIDDDRVKFFVGWFNETLEGYRPPPHHLLILNCDADLYASTSEVLTAFSDTIVADRWSISMSSTMSTMSSGHSMSLCGALVRRSRSSRPRLNWDT
jgi:Macrocin-O-methyltransferase (TylF)